MQEILRSFILETFPTSMPNQSILEDTSFIESGLIDSTGVLELVDFIEDQFGIEVEDSELIPENLDSLKNLSEYLKSKGV